MIRLAADDLEAAIELLEHQHPDQAVRDRHATERDQLLRPFAQGFTMAVGPADRERDGRELYFDGNASGSYDIYVASRTCQ